MRGDDRNREPKVRDAGPRRNLKELEMGLEPNCLLRFGFAVPMALQAARCPFSLMRTVRHKHLPVSDSAA